MTSRITASVLFLMITLAAVHAESAPNILFWSDDGDYALCHLSIPPGEGRTWHIVTQPNDLEFGGFGGAEFRVAGWPAGYLHIVTPNPNANVTLGDPLQQGVNVGFPDCQIAETTVLYTIQTINLGAGTGASFSIEQHTTPSNPNALCANVNPCGPVFLQVCIVGSTAHVNQGSGTPPADPSPVDTSTEVALNAQLAWSNGHPGSECAIGISSHRVYFGTDSDPPFVGEVSPLDNTVFDPGALLPSTTYFWRIEAIDTGFGISSPLWSFTTQDPVAVAEKRWHQVKQLYR